MGDDNDNDTIHCNVDKGWQQNNFGKVIFYLLKKDPFLIHDIVSFKYLKRAHLKIDKVEETNILLTFRPISVLCAALECVERKNTKNTNFS